MNHFLLEKSLKTTGLDLKFCSKIVRLVEKNEEIDLFNMKHIKT